MNTLPLFTTATNIQSSMLTQSGSGTTGKVGINTAAPATTLDVNGSATVRGTLGLPATGPATATAGKNSQSQDLVASAYNSSSKAAVPQTFQLQAEPAGNDTATASGTLNLLYGSGTATPAETGLKISNKGVITFAAGQTFPTVTGNETVTGNVTATELVSTVPTGTAPLKVTSTTEVANLNASLLGGKAASAFAQLAAANTFTANQTVNGSLSATGTVSGASFEIGGNLFAFGSYNNANAFLGFAGNKTMTGTSNTATGSGALTSDTTGFLNTAAGQAALYFNTTGAANTASGAAALVNNTTGGNNSASGASALHGNTTGSNNTAIGETALASNTTGNSNTAVGASSGETADSSPVTGSNNTFLGTTTAIVTGFLSNVTAIGSGALVSGSNSTAIGANAWADANNAMVLGSIAGVNGATATTSVGIGTPAPANQLDVYAQNTANAINGVSAGGNAVTGTSSTGNAMVANGNVSQSRTGGGWAKAMIYVNGTTAPYNIVRCFNSTLTGAAATTPPCGITFNENGIGYWNFTFNFEVDDRFVSATADGANSISVVPSGSDTLGLATGTPYFTGLVNAWQAENANFWVIVF